MPDFRFHRLDRDGRRQGAPVETTCHDEHEAVEHARSLIQRRRDMIEVWADEHFMTIVTRSESEAALSP